MSIEHLVAQPSIGDNFQHWEKVASALETKRMPPANLPQPTAAERGNAVSWIRTSLKDYIAKTEVGASAAVRAANRQIAGARLKGRGVVIIEKARLRS